MNSMGQQQPRNQCTDCRKKRRVSAARSKKRKQEDMAGQHQHERQMQGQNQHQQASQELQGHLEQKKNILSPKDATTMAWDAKVEAPGPFPRASQRPSNAFPSLPGLERSRPTASRDPSVTPVLPNSNFGRDPVPPTFEDAATTNVQTLRDMQHMRNVECLQEFDNLTRSTQMSPGSVFPPDPRFASKAPQEQSPAQPAQPQSDERYRPILSIVHTLPISLNGAELDFVVGQERQMFDQGRQTCLWMRGQDEATLQQYWRKREAAVVLGLLEVPMPSLQPKIGITRSQGSHKNMPGGNDR
ncbi:hypothetical protein CH35J_007568 [Colletotrichum higginsianum]|uniref:Uncharacterized protein n=1 Tax=Colletotrichum higginsianum TaxID=80884 RepID=A0A4T0VY25_9PEZI|nr:hypothetical protein CH35J_007568 [Colletotrichum higginsianum]